MKFKLLPLISLIHAIDIALKSIGTKNDFTSLLISYNYTILVFPLTKSNVFHVLMFSFKRQLSEYSHKIVLFLQNQTFPV
jgi:hypothetical protein